jgi:Uma2 family endonuclease
VRAARQREKGKIMSTASIRRYSREEYLALERQSDSKHEFHCGEIFAMAGGTANHSMICSNLVGSLGSQLRGHPCRRFDSNLRIRIDQDRYLYPDASIVCGEPQFEDEVQDVLLNPIVIFEVLSDSTQKYDRGHKFSYYRRLPSFREYLLISEDEPCIDRYYRHDDGNWEIADYRGVEASLELRAAPGCRLQLAELYDRVTFPPPAPQPEGIHPAK